MTDEVVLRDLHKDGVLVLTLHRPERNNAWNADMETAYFAALDDAAADPDVRAVVLTGHGKTFCPGMDMQRLDAASSGAVGTYMEGIRRPQTTTLYFPKPLIAAVNGGCAGIGCAGTVHAAGDGVGSHESAGRNRAARDGDGRAG